MDSGYGGSFLAEQAVVNTRVKLGVLLVEGERV